MESFLKFKTQTAQVYRIMGSDTNEQIDNLVIAQLNDVAYKAIRKRGVQKKLDERAVKNDVAFKKSEAELIKTHAKIDFNKVQNAHGATMDAKIGNCPLSMCSVIELMQNKDVMCLGLSIARSQATIADPTKLVIKDVYPVYMSLDAFMESSIFNLKMSEGQAAGGFDLKDEGKLAVGAGRENISGLMPLYLFAEHWELAKRKVQPLFGFMCTLEALGYTSQQFYTIPFLVLAKAIRKQIEEPSEANEQIFELVKETCQRMVGNNGGFKKQVVEQLIGFVENPASRTADVVPDISVQAAQAYAWSQLPADQKAVVNDDPQAAGESMTVSEEMSKRYSRFAVEEIIRRSNKGTDAPGKTQLLNLLVPKHAEIVNTFKSQVQDKAEQGLVNNAGDEYERFRAQADALRAQAQAQGAAQQANNAAQEEEKKGAAAEEEKKEGDGQMSIPQLIEEQIAGKPWLENMGKLTKGLMQNFIKQRCGFVKILSEMEGRGENPYANILEFFGGDEEILFAVLLQNAMHPKNSDRTGAVKDGSYIEILTSEDAHRYISGMVKTYLGNELNSAQSSVLNALASMQTMADLKKLVEAPDVFIAAVALSEKSFYEGKGDRTSFFKVVMELNPTRIPDLGRKLKLVTSKDFMGIPLYNDKMCQPDRVNRQTIFQLWMHCCRTSNAVSVEQMIEFQPHAEEQLRMYDKFVDSEGKTTLNPEEYKQFREQKAQEAAQKKKLKNAKKSGKAKLK